jgi:hypothetical protein
MIQTTLKEALLFKLSNGISLASSKELCIALFCSTDWLPNVESHEFTKKGIAEAFSFLAKKKLITKNTLDEELDCIRETDFWVQLINKSMVSGSFYDRDHVKAILTREINK